MAEKHFLIVIIPFSLVKAAMNAPSVCKLRKKCLTVIDQCAMVLKMPPFLHFSKKYIPSALQIFTAPI
jgi:hypothetical protein